jgi:hypothetical protein
MSPIFLSTAVCLILLQVFLPKRYAFVPLLVAAFNIGNVEFLGELTIVRVLILVGITRGIVTGVRPFDSSNTIDRLFLLFAFFAILSAPFHPEAPYDPYNERLGLILNVLGSFFYGRCYLTGEDPFKRLAMGSLIALLPLAVMLTLEVSTGRNYYYPHFGAWSATAQFRDGFRASGPFAHSILAGTSGAVTIALFIPYWKDRKKLAITGIAGCLLIVSASNSSGPIAATGFAFIVIYLWKKRQYIRNAKWGAAIGIVLLSLYMDRPFYYIIDSIDFTGGSTGWHRARLIEMAIDHIHEWWLFGTDYTRHWMPTGVSWSPDHSDLTNYYLHLGVIGGLPLTLLLIAIIGLCLKKLINHVFALQADNKMQEAFTIWCAIAALAAHASSFISISYFDQMFVLFYLLIAGISGLQSVQPSSQPKVQ